MKTILIATVLLTANTFAAPWCHISNSGLWSCYYYSLSLCQKRAETFGGMCVPNPKGDGFVWEDYVK